MGKVSADLQVNGKSNGQGKRSRIEIDADGDVVMGQEPKQRGNRGGKILRRKKRRGLDGGDIEMEDVEVCCSAFINLVMSFSQKRASIQKTMS